MYTVDTVDIPGTSAVMEVEPVAPFFTRDCESQVNLLIRVMIRYGRLHTEKSTLILEQQFSWK